MIDDESDYFSVDSNKWLTKEQREALRKREDQIRQEKHGSRLDRKVTLDFAGRRVVEDNSAMKNYDPSQDQTIKNIMALKIGDNSGSEAFVDFQRKTITDGDGVVNPNIKGPRPMVI